MPEHEEEGQGSQGKESSSNTGKLLHEDLVEDSGLDSMIGNLNINEKPLVVKGADYSGTYYDNYIQSPQRFMNINNYNNYSGNNSINTGNTSKLRIFMFTPEKATSIAMNMPRLTIIRIAPTTFDDYSRRIVRKSYA
jgi:hypothetical protein